jgi:hypothetical protein
MAGRTGHELVQCGWVKNAFEVRPPTAMARDRRSELMPRSSLGTFCSILADNCPRVQLYGCADTKPSLVSASSHRLGRFFWVPTYQMYA